VIQTFELAWREIMLLPDSFLIRKAMVPSLNHSG
jgi:hypothetical protein